MNQLSFQLLLIRHVMMEHWSNLNQGIHHHSYGSTRLSRWDSNMLSHSNMYHQHSLLLLIHMNLIAHHSNMFHYHLLLWSSVNISSLEQQMWFCLVYIHKHQLYLLLILGIVHRPCKVRERYGYLYILLYFHHMQSLYEWWLMYPCKM